jgi:hypothetical protein
MTTTTVRLPLVWDPVNDDEFELDEAIYVYGQRRQGKSTTVEKILLDLRRFYPIVFCFTATKRNNFWQQVLPDHKVIEIEATPEGSKQLNEYLSNILKLQESRIDEYRTEKSEEGHAEGNPLALVINEDIVADDTLRRVPMVSIVTQNGRHAAVANITLSQAWTGLKPTHRKNIDRFILFKATDHNVVDWVLHSFGPEVLAMYERVTQMPYRAFVINNKSTASPERKFMMYKADKDELDRMLHRNIHLGDNRLWGDIDIHEQKATHPIIKLPAKATLSGRFNRQRQQPPTETDEQLQAVADDDYDDDATSGEEEAADTGDRFKSCSLL